MGRIAKTGWWRGGGRIFLPLLALLLVPPAFPGGGVVAASLEILTPAPGARVAGRHPETHLVLRQPQSGEGAPVWVEAEGERIGPRVTEEDQGNSYLHFRLPLKPGLNRFLILPEGAWIEVRYRPLRAAPKLENLARETDFFHRDDRLPPDCAGCHDLRSAVRTGEGACVACHSNLVEDVPRLHSTSVNSQCLACHQQSEKPWRIGFPAAPVESLCLTCHTGKRGWSSQEHVHGPMVFGGCTVCHNPHGDENRYQLWAEGTTALCIACHSDKESLLPKAQKPVPFAHRIIHGAGCVACHDPHASDQAFMLHKAVNPLCVGCHSGFAGTRRGHPVGGHPVAASKERRRPGRALTCTSCHDPHGSAYRYLLIGDHRGGQVCVLCHK